MMINGWLLGKFVEKSVRKTLLYHIEKDYVNDLTTVSYRKMVDKKYKLKQDSPNLT